MRETAIVSMVIFQAQRIYTYGVAAAFLQASFSQVVYLLNKNRKMKNLAIFRVAYGCSKTCYWPDFIIELTHYYCGRRIGSELLTLVNKKQLNETKSNRFEPPQIKK